VPRIISCPRSTVPTDPERLATFFALDLADRRLGQRFARSSFSVGDASGFTQTSATCSPHLSSGMPKTATSATPDER
jgi:hypothetical protein